MKCSRPNCDGNVWRSYTDLCKAHRDMEVRRCGLNMVDAERARKHLLALAAAGFGPVQVQQMSGVAFQRLANIRAGGNAKIRRATEAAILAVSIPDDVVEASLDNAILPQAGSLRRLQALQAIGYTNEMLARECDVTAWTIYRLLAGEQRVIASTARRIRQAFDRLQMTCPPESIGTRRARMRAEKRGWPPPFAWDEDTIDDPEAMPDAKVCIWASTRRLRALCRMGFSQKYMSERLDIPTDKTSEILRFLGPIDYSLADAIEKLFNELRDTPKEDERLTTRRAAQARSVTAGYGWVFPDDLGDIFKKPLKRELESMNRSNNERADTAKKMLSEGVSKSEIARRMNVNPTTVYAWLREAA